MTTEPATARSATLLALLVGFVLLTVSCGGDEPSATGDQPDATPTSVAADGSSSSSAPQPEADRDEPLLEQTRWVQLDFDGLLDEGGRRLIETGEVVFGGRVADRGLDGTVYLATLDGVLVIEPGATEATAGPVGDVSHIQRQPDGTVLAIVDGESVDAATGQPLTSEPSYLTPERIVAANGLAVEHVPGDLEFDGEGWIAKVNRGDGVRLLDEQGEQVAVWTFGGPGAPLVSIVDFDGRHLIIARGPEEPALPAWDHVVIDLDITADGIEAFRALPGTVSLATAERADRPDSLLLPPIDLCSTTSPVRVKEPPADLPEPVAGAFDQMALAVATCDTWFTGWAGGDLDWQDNATWEAIQTSLLGPYSASDDGSWTWQASPAASITIDRRGVVELGIEPTAPVGLWITMDENWLSVAGSVGPQSAAVITEAATAGADRLNRDIDVRFLSGEGTELDDLVADALGDLLANLIERDVASLEAHLDADRLRVWVDRPNGRPVLGEREEQLFAEAGLELAQVIGDGAVTEAERSVFADLQAIATGDRDAATRIPWAPDVLLAAGSLVGAERSGDELAEPSAWLLDVGPFRGGVGSVSALAALADGDPVWTEPTVGPHPHCASPPVRAPGGLAGLRRVSIQTTGDSCLSWSTIDVFFDGSGAVAGVSYDLWEP